MTEQSISRWELESWVIIDFGGILRIKSFFFLCLLKNDTNSLLVQPSEIIEIVRWRITKWENQKYSPGELYLHHHRNDGNWAERKMKFFLFPCFFFFLLFPPCSQLYLKNSETLRSKNAPVILVIVHHVPQHGPPLSTQLVQLVCWCSESQCNF